MAIAIPRTDPMASPSGYTCPNTVIVLLTAMRSAAPRSFFLSTFVFISFDSYLLHKLVKPEGVLGDVLMDELYLLSLIHISEPTRLGMISYAVFCLKKKK